ncbi:MAG: D-aminoacyl-tRNA deacylase [Eubacteriales bacterium]|nr:D-aminoacyl-tRNA deacylase [Eubacteriales bacterium]
MRAIIQRVSSASVKVKGETIAAIDEGFLILLGFTHSDSSLEVEKIWQKIKGLRIFEDEDAKVNCDLKEVSANVLIVSQFTLYANLRRGRRPSFTEAAEPHKAEALYNEFVELARQDFPQLGTGEFGAMMEVSLTNHGPFTLYLDSEDLAKARRA